MQHTDLNPFVLLALTGLAQCTPPNSAQTAPNSAAVAQVAPAVAARWGKQTPLGASAKIARSFAQSPENSVTFAFGAGPQELGVRRDQEAAPEAPMAIAIAADGQIAILDQVNQRVRIRHALVQAAGTTDQQIPLDRTTFQDLAWQNMDHLWLLDRLGAQPAVVLIDLQGTVIRQVPLVESMNPGGITGLFWRDDGLYLEHEHADLQRIADGEGVVAAEKASIWGRFAGDARLRARMLDPQLAVIEGKNTDGTARFATRVAFDLPVLAFRALLSDAAGRFVLVADLASSAPAAPDKVLQAQLIAVLLGADGTELGRFDLPVTGSVDEQFAPYALDDHGQLFALLPRKGDMQLLRIDLQVRGVK